MYLIRFSYLALCGRQSSSWIELEPTLYRLCRSALLKLSNSFPVYARFFGIVLPSFAPDSSSVADDIVQFSVDLCDKCAEGTDVLGWMSETNKSVN